MTKLDSGLFPGVSRYVEIHRGFGDAHARFVGSTLDYNPKVKSSSAFIELHLLFSQRFEKLWLCTTQTALQ